MLSAGERPSTSSSSKACTTGDPGGVRLPPAFLCELKVTACDRPGLTARVGCARRHPRRRTHRRGRPPQRAHHQWRTLHRLTGSEEHPVPAGRSPRRDRTSAAVEFSMNFSTRAIHESEGRTFRPTRATAAAGSLRQKEPLRSRLSFAADVLSRHGRAPLLHPSTIDPSREHAYDLLHAWGLRPPTGSRRPHPRLGEGVHRYYWKHGTRPTRCVRRSWSGGRPGAQGPAWRDVQGSAVGHRLPVPRKVTTKLFSIRWQVVRTGRVTPGPVIEAGAVSRIERRGSLATLQQPGGRQSQGRC